MNEDVNLRKLLQILHERWKSISVMLIIFILIGGYISFFLLEPKYKVNGTLFIGKNFSEGEENTQGIYSLSEVNMLVNLMDNYGKIMKSRNLLERVTENNNIDISLETLINNLEVNSELGTQILDLSLTYSNGEVAAKALNQIVYEFIDYAEELVPNIKVEVLESAIVPDKPASPSIIKDTILIIAVSMILSIIITLSAVLLDNKIRHKEDLELLLGVPVVGCISVIKKGV